MSFSSTTTTSTTQKRGRKPTQTNYFDVAEENNEFLRGPLDKRISSIIRRYKLYRKDMDFTDIHTDTHSFLMTKVDKFKPDKNKKAYSYFGTICKNYLMGQIIKDQKETNRKISYEDITSQLESRPDMIYYIEHEKTDADTVILEFIKQLNNNKSNKNTILLSIREMTNLSTKEIRSAMKKYKKLYFTLINDMID